MLRTDHAGASAGRSDVGLDCAVVGIVRTLADSHANLLSELTNALRCLLVLVDGAFSAV